MFIAAFSIHNYENIYFLYGNKIKRGVLMAIIKTETDFPLSMVRGTSQIINLLAANVDEKSFAF
ncbi:MAG: hypothetical protein MR911_10945 [Spirochaetia bacterium]|nr:hypothetical protein [Spirochaetia bacterium]